MHQNFNFTSNYNRIANRNLVDPNQILQRPNNQLQKTNYSNCTLKLNKSIQNFQGLASPQHSTQSNSEEEPDSSKLSLFVGGLSSKCTAQALMSYFQVFGEIKSCEPQTWKKNVKRCRGFAIVICGNYQSYDLILKQKQHVFETRNIECKPMMSTEQDLKVHNKELISKKIFVGNIPLQATNNDLATLMSRFGEIDIAYIIHDNQTQKSRGFGYICYKKKESCVKALEKNKLILLNTVITCLPYSLKFLKKELEEGLATNLALQANMLADPNSYQIQSPLKHFAADNLHFEDQQKEQNSSIPLPGSPKFNIVEYVFNQQITNNYNHNLLNQFAKYENNSLNKNDLNTINFNNNYISNNSSTNNIQLPDQLSNHCRYDNNSQKNDYDHNKNSNTNCITLSSQNFQFRSQKRQPCKVVTTCYGTLMMKSTQFC